MLPIGSVVVPDPAVQLCCKFPHWHDQPVIAVRTLFEQTNWLAVQVGSEIPQPQPPHPHPPVGGV
jgi:hypothetical protein